MKPYSTGSVFWRRFDKALVEKRIAENQWHYYRDRVVRWGRWVVSYEGECGEVAVVRWVTELGDKLELEDWQLGQAVAAVEIASREVLNRQWAKELDWETLKHSFVRFSTSDATLAREGGRRHLREVIQQKNLSKAHEDVVMKLCEVLRLQGYAYRTEESYRERVVDFLRWSESCKESRGHSQDFCFLKAMGWVSEYLSYLSIERQVAISTQKLAINALSYFFRAVGEMENPDFGRFCRAKVKRKIPTVLTEEEVADLLSVMKGQAGLIAKLLYGAGLRQMECLRLRVKDLDFGNGYVVVQDGKGGKSRRVPLPRATEEELRKHLEGVRVLFHEDRAAKVGPVFLPNAYARKNPGAGVSWEWQWVFPSRKLSVDPRANVVRRHHVSERVIVSPLKKAVAKLQIPKKVGCHTLRHSFATHLILNQVDVRTVQELMGHEDVNTTMMYVHALDRPGDGMLSPLDRLKILR